MLTQCSVPRRLESLRTEVQTLERKEREGQDKYRELAAAQDELSLSINEMEDELAMREAEAVNEYVHHIALITFS